MKKIIGLFVLLSLPILLFAQSITFMSYNIRYDTDRDSLDSWTNRKAFLLNQVQFYQPDIMGTQEGLKHQLDYLQAGLEHYEYKGIGRDDGQTKGEYTAVFYNKNKFNLLKEGTFWLSPTPDTVGLGWDAVCNRTCTYLLLEDQQNQQKYWVFNTHFDHRGKVARQNATLLILEKIQQLNTANHPIILMGDFNVEPTDAVYTTLTNALADTKKVSQLPPFGNEGTFNGFKFHQPLTRRIDYIFADTNQVNILKYATLSDSKDCHYPSDHLPVFVEVSIK
ncbi:MAG: endonuclease/exonuclease/phosphatase family protein [Saprospiraceae bacterium]